MFVSTTWKKTTTNPPQRKTIKQVSWMRQSLHSVTTPTKKWKTIILCGTRITSFRAEAPHSPVSVMSTRPVSPGDLVLPLTAANNSASTAAQWRRLRCIVYGMKGLWRFFAFATKEKPRVWEVGKWVTHEKERLIRGDLLPDIKAVGETACPQHNYNYTVLTVLKLYSDQRSAYFFSRYITAMKYHSTYII